MDDKDRPVVRPTAWVWCERCGPRHPAADVVRCPVEDCPRRAAS